MLSGLTCIQKSAERGGSGEESICILQFIEAGDIFYQIMEHEQTDTSLRPAAEDEPPPQQAARELQQSALFKATTSGSKTEKLLSSPERTQSGSKPVVSDTSSDEGMIGPTQGAAGIRFVAETPERKQRVGNASPDYSSDDSESEGKKRILKLLHLQVVVNNDPEVDDGSGLDGGGENGIMGNGKAGDAEEPAVVEKTVNSLSRVDPPEPQTPVKFSDGALAIWKQWLQKLMNKTHKKPRSRRLQHFTVSTDGLLSLAKDTARDPSEEERLQSLNCELRACMSKRSLLVNSAVNITPQDLVRLPNQVDTEVWKDDLSQRLTVSWQGEEKWQAWWDDHLGLNRKEKIEALRRKRRKQKEAKRAAGQRLGLSRSFTSSLSYQSDVSESMGWSSAVSTGAWSDNEGLGTWSQEGFTDGDTSVPTPTTTRKQLKDGKDEQQSPSSSGAPCLTHMTTPASQRRSNPLVKKYLNSLFASQVRERWCIRNGSNFQVNNFKFIPTFVTLSHDNM